MPNINMDEYYTKEPLILTVDGKDYPAKFTKAAAQAVERAAFEGKLNTEIAELGLTASLGLEKLPQVLEDNFGLMMKFWEKIANYYKLDKVEEGRKNQVPFPGDAGQPD